MTLPVARVAVDVSLAHLDRPFDYRVGAAEDTTAVPGARVRVRFAGRLRDGFVLERLATSDSDRELSPLAKVTSAEPVLTPEIAALVRAVADQYAGCFADVVRLAIPPRHAATEKAEPTQRPPLPELDPTEEGAFSAYPTGPGLLHALRSGRSPRAYWQVIPAHHPSSDWADGFAAAARATADSGRGSVLVVPDQRDLARLRAACTRVLGRTGFVELTAEAGPAARYRAFLAALRGDVRVVIGNRAAAYAPVRDLGLVAVWDDGDDLLAEQRSPYPHTRTVLALRATQQRSAVLAAGFARSCEAEQWVQRGWLQELAADRTQTRHTAPRVRAAVDSDRALARDPAARSARLPHEVFELVRASLPQGPVLIQVPRSGYLVALVCGDCREPARCRRCHGPLRQQHQNRRTVDLGCSWCGVLHPDWQCPICESRSLRAPVVGAERTAEELGRAFPNTVIRQSSQRWGAARGAEHPRPRRGHPGGRADSRRRVRGCCAAGRRPAAAPRRSAVLGGSAAALAGRGRAGPLGGRRRLGDRGGGQRGAGAAGPGPAGSGGLRRPRARRTGGGALPAGGQGGDRGRHRLDPDRRRRPAPSARA